MSRNFVYLTGGLGNQIFQICAALSESPSHDLLVKAWGNPASNGEFPEVAALNWPSNVQFEKTRKLVITKFISLLLRSGLKPSSASRSIMERWLRFIIASYLFFTQGIFSKVILNRGIGFSQKKSKSGKSHFFIGYFQSFVFAEHLLSCNALDLLSTSEEVEINLTGTVGLHIRLGDYLREDKFGIPGEAYYLNSLFSIPKYQEKKLIVFTNSPNLVREYFPNLPWGQIAIHANNEDNSVETLKDMANCEYLIIGNSTFSWWAAFLSKKVKVVTYPHPWFKSTPEPARLFPRNWKPIPAEFR